MELLDDQHASSNAAAEAMNDYRLIRPRGVGPRQVIDIAEKMS